MVKVEVMIERKTNDFPYLNAKDVEEAEGQL